MDVAGVLCPASLARPQLNSGHKRHVVFRSSMLWGGMLSNEDHKMENHEEVPCSTQSCFVPVSTQPTCGFLSYFKTHCLLPPGHCRGGEWLAEIKNGSSPHAHASFVPLTSAWSTVLGLEHHAPHGSNSCHNQRAWTFPVEMVACSSLGSGSARVTWHLMMPICCLLLQRRRQGCLAIVTD
jgi:hypothetical protein